MLANVINVPLTNDTDDFHAITVVTLNVRKARSDIADGRNRSRNTEAKCSGQTHDCGGDIGRTTYGEGRGGGPSVRYA
eukprot:1952752-Rhodomonas_salina.2